jgi:hypothetical protein
VWLVLAAVVLCLAGHAQAETYPTLTLTNGDLVVTVYLPDAAHGYYRGSRFVWNGMIAQVSRGAHTYYGELHLPHDPLKHDHAPGPAEEFGLKNPAGYAEAPIGGSFLKVGVGVMTKTEARYLFKHDYPVLSRPARTVALDPATRTATFAETLALYDGWGYAYTKTITLADGAPELTITHRLRNTGTRPIATSWYCHNTLRFDDQPVDPAYTLTFPFAPTFLQKVAAPLVLDGATMTVAPGTVREQYLECPTPGDGATTGFTVAHARTGTAVTTTVHAPASFYALYVVGRALCPEPYVKIDIAPGAEFAWRETTRYGAADRDARP